MWGPPRRGTPYVRGPSKSTRPRVLGAVHAISRDPAPREVVHRPPFDSDAARGLPLAGRDFAAVWARAPHPRGHLAHRRGVLRLVEGYLAPHGFSGLLRGCAGRRQPG